MKHLWIAAAVSGLLAGCSAEKQQEPANTISQQQAPNVMLNTDVPAPVAKKSAV